MPYLREAVEKKRRYFINILVREGIYKISDPFINHLTLTDLEKEYKNLQRIKGN